MILGETVLGAISDTDICSELVAVDQADGSVAVYWDTAESAVGATSEYLVELPAEAADGDGVPFGGIVESSDSRYSVAGDETPPVVDPPRGSQFCRTRLTDVDQTVEDLVAHPVADSGVHCKGLLEAEDAILREGGSSGRSPPTDWVGFVATVGDRFDHRNYTARQKPSIYGYS